MAVTALTRLSGGGKSSEPASSQIVDGRNLAMADDTWALVCLSWKFPIITPFCE
jgi:hypothetical protein